MTENSSDVQAIGHLEISNAFSCKALAANLIRADDIYNKQFRIRLLNPKSRLILFIAVNESVNVKQALLDSPLSYRAFYVLRDNLLKNNLISLTKGSHDNRTRFMSLTDKIKDRTAWL